MCGWISFQGGKQAGSVCGKTQRRLLPKLIHNLRYWSCGFWVFLLFLFLQRHQSVNQQSPESQISQTSTEQHGSSSHSASLFVLLPRGDVFWRGWRKKGAGDELELREVGRRRSGRMQLSSMVSEQNTAERKNHDSREHHSEDNIYPWGV